ncbi:MAG: DUF4474 domain-containing protein [Ruminococcaceae bacterium]|nr:DUF4474 domain-containing protein [Oscillospiraceae bacterium]
MKKFSVRFISFFFALFIVSTTIFAATTAVSEQFTGQKAAALQLVDSLKNDTSAVPDTRAKKGAQPSLTISSDSLTVTVNRKIQLVAVVTGTDVLPEITWTSSDEKIATVDKKGKVKGVKAGKANITASCVIDGETYYATYAVKVVTSSNLIKDLLVNQQVLSYQYSYEDDYYYTNDKEAWQYNFGYGKLYDIAAPYILLEYDYVRVFFEYEGKDWMLQMWKGQYGLIFYGSEIGIYTKPQTDKEDNFFTFYNCPAEEDWLKMQMTLYHQQLNGEYVREFTRPYDTYWWCTGFKDGHLRVEEPADELRVHSKITFKDKEMANLVAQGLLDCGFKQASDRDKIQTDGFYLDGDSIHFKWQHINEAENTMPIKVGAGFIIATNIISFLLSILSFFSLLGLGALFLI